MRRLVYSFTFLLASFTQGYSQDYTPFDLTDTKWVMSYLYPMGGFNATHTFAEVYTKGDTLIDGKEYTTIAMKNLCRLINSQDGVAVDEDMVTEEYELGALREEDKRVYFYRFEEQIPLGYYVRGIPQGAGVDHLLYDFNVSVGDTIHFSSGMFSVITEIGDQNGAKAFYVINNGDESFANPSDLPFVEGKGSDEGLFASYYSNFSLLECYGFSESVDGIGCTVCENYITNTDDIFVTSEDILFPNPAYNVLSVRDEYVDQLNRVSVYTIHGQLLSELEFINYNSSIDLSRFSAGIVLFELEFKNGQRRIERIVKRD